MNTILFIRHAETDMAGRFCGHSDPCLNARGQTHLAELLRTLHAEPIREVYASDLLRARETARAIAASHAIDYHVRPALREICFGQWEGLTWNEVMHRDGVYAQRWADEYPNLCTPGGEDFFDFERRVLDEIELLTQKASVHDLAVVTHAGVMRTILRRLNGRSEEDAWAQTASYCSIIRYNTSSFQPVRLEEVSL